MVIFSKFLEICFQLANKIASLCSKADMPYKHSASQINSNLALIVLLEKLNTNGNTTLHAQNNFMKK